MSLWTHVNGALRIDNINYTLEPVSVRKYKKELKSLFKTVSFKGLPYEWAACNVPCGTEGSLNVSIWVANDGEMATINFFGDLRGFTDTDGVIEWIDNIIIDNSLSVRDGIMHMNEEVYVYKEKRDNETFDIVKQGFIKA